MRWYKIEVGDRVFDATNNPNALNVEFDISTLDSDQGLIAATVVIWGIALEDISQATDFIGKPVTVSGGMQPGLPLANVQAANAGILTKGVVWESFGNWVGTEMWLTMVIKPGAEGPPPRPFEAQKPRNLVLNWKKGTQLADALKQTLQTGYPDVKANISISPQLVAPQDNIGYYPNLRELNGYLRGVSHQILTGKKMYPGVGCCFQKGEITVHDGTSKPGPKKIAFNDLIGQPTWIAPFTIQIKTVMRGDLKASDVIELPPTRTIINEGAQSGLNTPLTFQGTFQVYSLRHVGNFRQSDGAAWVTIVNALQQGS